MCFASRGIVRTAALDPQGLKKNLNGTLQNSMPRELKLYSRVGEARRKKASENIIGRGKERQTRLRLHLG